MEMEMVVVVGNVAIALVDNTVVYLWCIKSRL